MISIWGGPIHRAGWKGWAQWVCYDTRGHPFARQSGAEARRAHKLRCRLGCCCAICLLPKAITPQLNDTRSDLRLKAKKRPPSPDPDFALLNLRCKMIEGTFVAPRWHLRVVFIVTLHGTYPRH
jgi:hypothetical protein